MFVLDTNILSAIMSARASPQLAAWIAGQPEDALFTTTICQAEILAGLAVMPEGVSNERVKIIRAYGGEVRMTPRVEGIRGAIAETERMAENGDVFLPRQFSNSANVEAHAQTTGPELYLQLKSEGLTADAFVY